MADARQALEALLNRNRPFTKPGSTDYNTDLGVDEPAFQAWLKQNNVPFNPYEQPQDYDMRGFWRGLQVENPIAKSAVDPHDSALHYPDYWKTPYHETFSNQSQWATPDAPKWNDKDQLVGPNGEILFDPK